MLRCAGDIWRCCHACSHVANLCAGREIIANLSKAAGLATMIAAMRPDIDNIDEYVRNTTARAFSVVASALGVPALLPFLKAVCLSKKSWQVRALLRQHCNEWCFVTMLSSAHTLQSGNSNTSDRLPAFAMLRMRCSGADGDECLRK